MVNVAAVLQHGGWVDDKENPIGSIGFAVFLRLPLAALGPLAFEGRSKRLVSEIFKVCRDTEVATAHKLNDGLQVVFLFSCDANLSIL